MDPRLVLAVLERAAEMFEADAAPFFATLAAAANTVGGLKYRDGSLWHAVLVAVRLVERYETTEERIASARGAAATLRSHILSVCLLVGALAGALPIEARRLIAAYCAGDADALLALADLVEERGLTGPLAQWAEERQGWLEATGHEHVWLPWVSGDGDRAIWASRGPSNFDGVRRCTCGVFEHEHSRPCADANCQREFGHHGLHMSRSWDAQAGLEIVDEWGNVDEHARDIMQRYLDAQPDPLMSSFYDD